MLAKLQNSWGLVKASAQVLQADKELLVFPAISGIAVVVVSASFFLPLLLFGGTVGALAEGGGTVLGYVLLFLFYFCQYFVIIFFNSALVGAAMIRLEGGNPTVGDGLRIAGKRLGVILGYAAIAATVGMVLRLARERSKTLGRLALGLAGMAWSLATFLVVPVLVTRDIGPLEAIKESARILRRTWGEQLAGNVGIGFVFGLISLLLALVAIPVMVLAFTTGQVWVIALTVIAFVIAFLLLALVNAALSGIYAAALYRFATGGEVGGGFDHGFDDGMLRQAFTARR